MFDYSFVDLDDTLFHTYMFKEDMFGCFARCGVSREDYLSSYRKAVFGPLEGYFDYTFEKHANILKELGYIIPDSTIDELNNLLKKNYNDPEAKDFLLGLKKISSKLVLLTAGERKMQQNKINSTGLEKYFDQVVIIDGGKSQAIVDVAGQAKNILFVNDNLKENIEIKNNLPYVMVLAKKHKVLWDNDDYKINKDLPFFDSLIEIKNYAARFV